MQINKLDNIRNNGYDKYNKLLKIPLNSIIVDKQVRTEFDEEKIKELAESISTYGLEQPIIVYENPFSENKDKTEYCLWLGENRFRAHKYLYEEKGETEFGLIDAILRKPPHDERQKKVMQLSENIQRQSLSQKDLREALQYLKETGMSNKEIANEIKKTESYVSQILGAEELVRRLKKEGIEADKISNSNSTLSELNCLPIEVLKKIAENNGTISRSEARNIKEKSKKHKIKKEDEAIGFKNANAEHAESIEEADHSPNQHERHSDEEDVEYKNIFVRSYTKKEYKEKIIEILREQASYLEDKNKFMENFTPDTKDELDLQVRKVLKEIFSALQDVFDQMLEGKAPNLNFILIRKPEKKN